MPTMGAMRGSRGAEEVASKRPPLRAALTLSGALMLAGLVVNAIQRGIFHPSGEEDHHEAIFAEYAASQGWVATHFAEFILVLVALAGLLVLCNALRQDTPCLALLATGAVIATGAMWAVLQAVDGVTLKQAVDAWATASGPDKAARFADAEAIRWAEWGLQSYFRLLLGVVFLLLGVATAVSRLIPRWLGVLLLLGGLLSLFVGFSVGYEGLESPFQDALVLAFQLVVLVFAIGLLAVGLRMPEPGSREAGP